MTTKINLQNIPTNKNYEGYLWWSDQEKPDVYLNDIPLKLPAEEANPFVIEGNLWCKTDHLSYLIRFIDGLYLVYKFDLTQPVAKKQLTFHSYLPNRMEGIKKLRFIEFWEPKQETYDKVTFFEVLKPAFIAFVGFKKIEP